jgi:hypothetical protein
MSSPTDFVTALYGAILGAKAASGGAQAGTTTYVTLEWPGLPVDPQQYGNIWASDNPAGSPEALEAFSDLVDSVPALSPLYEPVGISLSQIYALMLQATVHPGPVADAFAAAQASFAGLVRGSLENPAAQYHPSVPAPRTWCDPSGQAQWTTVSIGPDNPPPPPPPPALREILARPTLMQWHVTQTPVERPVLAGRPGVRPMAATAAPPPIANMNATRLRIAALRPNLANLAIEAPVTTVPPAALTRLQAMRVGLQPMLAIKVALTPAVPSPAAPTPPPVQGQPVTTSRLKATFKFLRVEIKRPWVNTTLLHLPGWSIDGIAAGAISNGKTDNNPGMLPLLPIAFIAVKDINISGSWSDSDRQAAGAALAGGTNASFGPFTLSANGSPAGTFNASSLVVPGIQIIAWICNVIPLLPPG